MFREFALTLTIADRTVALGRLPFASLEEFGLLFACGVVGAAALFAWRYDLPILGSLLLPVVLPLLLFVVLVVSACGRDRPPVDLVTDGVSFFRNGAAVTHRDEMGGVVAAGLTLWGTSARELAGFTVVLHATGSPDVEGCQGAVDATGDVYGCTALENEAIHVQYVAACPGYAPVVHQLGHAMLERRTGDPDRQHRDPRFAEADRLRSAAVQLCQEEQRI
jgi:hypothetical protein